MSETSVVVETRRPEPHDVLFRHRVGIERELDRKACAALHWMA
jgi:hypothetical protein